VTGASGLVGSALSNGLRERGHVVIGLSRSEMSGVDIEVRGDFRHPESLEEATSHSVDAVVHLAAEVGGCTEQAGMEVNVEGTRRLLRHCLDSGIRRFAIASSIAAAIGLDRRVVPERLPVGDSTDSIATDAYGISKWLMEQLVFYFQRQVPDAMVFMPRIGVVVKPDAAPASIETVQRALFPLISLSTIALEDVVRSFIAALEGPLRPGVHRFNLVSPILRSPLTVQETLPLLFGDQPFSADLSWYDQPGREHASFFESERVWEFLALRPHVDPRTMTSTNSKENSQ